jgi:hypothetical protein
MNSEYAADISGIVAIADVICDGPLANLNLSANNLGQTDPSTGAPGDWRYGHSQKERS